MRYKEILENRIFCLAKQSGNMIQCGRKSNGAPGRQAAAAREMVTEETKMETKWKIETAPGGVRLIVGELACIIPGGTAAAMADEIERRAECWRPVGEYDVEVLWPGQSVLEPGEGNPLLKLSYTTDCESDTEECFITATEAAQIAAIMRGRAGTL